jgi:hypothetical protein
MIQNVRTGDEFTVQLLQLLVVLRPDVVADWGADLIILMGHGAIQREHSTFLKSGFDVCETCGRTPNLHESLDQFPASLS